MTLLPLRKCMCLTRQRKLGFFFLLVVGFYIIPALYTGQVSYNANLKESAGADQRTQTPGSDQSAQACVQPDLDIWSPEVKKFFKDVPAKSCSADEENWVYTANGSIYISEVAEKKHGNIACQYRPLKRVDDYEATFVDPYKPFVNGTPLSVDFFEVVCIGKDKVEHRNLHLGIRRDPELQKQPATDPTIKNTNSLGYNILMLGFDATSRLSWRRNLPKTHEYLKETLGSLELEGFNIVGDGTGAALVPILTGNTTFELPEARRGFKGAAPLDGYPWIWKDLKKLGYVTQFGGDGAHRDVFNFLLLGFNKPPVDHYLRPYYLQAKSYKRGDRCIGYLSRHLIHSNWIKDFVEMYPNKPKFSFVFSIEYSHDSLTKLKWADDDLKDYLEFLRVKGHLDNTVLILMSDHGARNTRFRQTFQGKYEERMPYFTFRFPPKFQQEYPKAMKNFLVNTKRLTTPFDVHATFKDLINFTGAGVGDLRNRGISLFKEIPPERTCEDAGIEPHWCACLNWMDVSLTDKLVQRAVDHLLLTINNVTRDHRNDCVELSLLNITSAVKFSPGDQVLKFNVADIYGTNPKFNAKTKALEVLYQITITTKPNLGKFEATRKYLVEQDRFVGNLDEISRLDLYGKQPHCVMDKLPLLRPYCYCHKQLPQT